MNKYSVNKLMLKKSVSFFLALLLLFLAACGKENDTVASDSTGKYSIEGIPEFVPSEEKFEDINKKYVLPDGFVYEYVPEKRPDFINFADYSGEGWKENTRIKSIGTEDPSDNLYVTNFIPCKTGDIIRVKNADAINSFAGSDVVNWCYYDDNKTIISTITPYFDEFEKITWNENGEIERAEVGYIDGKEIKDLAYVRMTIHFDGEFAPEDLIITVNEEIEYVDGENYEWSRGEQYIHSEWYDEIKDGIVKANGLYKSNEETTTFIVTSDIHVFSENDEYISNIGKVSAEVMRKCDIPFFMSLGDLSTQSSGYDISVFDDCMERVLGILSPIPQKNLILTVGNHDGATGQKEMSWGTAYYRHQLNNEQRSEIFFDWQRESNPDKQFGGDGTFYYLDDENTKTRYIMLNSFWSEWEGDPETGFVEDIQHAFMQTPLYGQEQLLWFANEALNMPKGYCAIIGTHHASTPNDYEMLKNIISAYVNREKYSGSYEGEQDWQSSSIDVDYSSAKGELIAIFQGHNHKDAVDTETFDIPCITVTTSGAYYAVKDDPAPQRNPRSATETTIDIVTIDKEDRAIYFTRIGAGRDRKIDY